MRSRSLARRRLALVASSLALGLCACIHRPPRLEFGARGRISDPAVAFAAVRARVEKIRSVQGEAKVSVETPDGSAHDTQLIAAERPGKARLDAESLFGPLATFTTDGHTFALADLHDHRFYSGPATAAAVARLLPLRLPPEELVSLLLGVPPLPAGATPTRLRVDDRRGLYELTLTGGGESERLLLDPQTLRPVESAFGERPGLSAYRATFEDFSGPLDLPRVVTLRAHGGKVELRWRDRDLNPKLDPAMFRQSAPEGFERGP